ncbi:MULTISPECIES: hypothetical protein [Shewanella]|uniref:hypothetical protein n=1 Tax=Shewanella TaxID=22 RepID=UPI000B34652F|nr:MULTISPECIES: hypothetical protein [Shewanella]AYV11543.1 hypothetical protein EEY24_00815 [Shewanella algae]QXN27440.1 hypothetical protein KVP08_023395 [Shewanella putrefaciens]
MKTELLDALLNAGFAMRIWDDRYSKGIWVCIALYSRDLEEVEDVSDAGDLDMIPATDYLLSTDWLPIVLGDTLLDGLDKLEQRLATLPREELARSSKWTNAVCEALEHLRQVSNTSRDYGYMDGRFRTLSNDYSQVWAVQ